MRAGPTPWPCSPPKTAPASPATFIPASRRRTAPARPCTLAIPDSLEETSARVKSAGGKVLGEPVEIPAGRFVYCQDPDGNSLGLFEYQ